MTLLLREAIGGTIRRARTERRRTLRDVSREARVSLGYLSEVERGRKEPSSELLAAICEALELPLPELLDEVADALRPAPRPVPAGVGAAPRGRAGDEPGMDEALRTAVEEAFEPASDEAASPASASMSASLPAPAEPAEPAAPRTVALPEPEGAPTRDDGEQVVAPVEGATPARLVGLVTLPPAASGPGPTAPVVRAAA
ncbi:transcriptional regulator with XRE-family HTH domain [Actinomycetospora cinnamomea]|uniref:Transcriptional regulator with XRE-family HTH domain n=1 Tax=Actinomycetospora cinnamomea TaxID=663609 RepID=A0A2U1FQI7_9PSEU|nr:transcriptional regulator with XRE-family HTH domain [Actinomycetospora cinnamomea]